MFALTHFLWKRAKRHYKMDGASYRIQPFLVGRMDMARNESWGFSLLSKPLLADTKRIPPPTTLVSVKEFIHGINAALAQPCGVRLPT